MLAYRLWQSRAVRSYWSMRQVQVVHPSVTWASPDRNQLWEVGWLKAVLIECRQAQAWLGVSITSRAIDHSPLPRRMVSSYMQIFLSWKCFNCITYSQRHNTENKSIRPIDSLRIGLCTPWTIVVTRRWIHYLSMPKFLLILWVLNNVTILRVRAHH